MVHLCAHGDDALEELGELFFKVAFDEVGAVDAEDGGFEEGVDELSGGTNMPESLSGFRDVLEDFVGWLHRPSKTGMPNLARSRSRERSSWEKKSAVGCGGVFESRSL